MSSHYTLQCQPLGSIWQGLLYMFAGQNINGWEVGGKTYYYSAWSQGELMHHTSHCCSDAKGTYNTANLSADNFSFSMQ